jgi:hypothetical protein
MCLLLRNLGTMKRTTLSLPRHLFLLLRLRLCDDLLATAGHVLRLCRHLSGFPEVTHSQVWTEEARLEPREGNR